MSADRALDRYLSGRAVTSPWSVSGVSAGNRRGAIVIPVLAESAALPATLASLAVNPPDLLRQFHVVVVINHREDAPDADKADNGVLLARMPELAARLPINLAWIDAASPGLELPERSGGVGMARKIGFDLALPLLDRTAMRPLLISLDADTIVRPDYLPAIIRHFDRTGEGGAVIPFSHRPAESPSLQTLIDRYELFLRAYVLGLELAGSPYAFHTVGSAMACTLEAYVRAGGMNTRRAGEDFYFLQHLRKTSGVAQVAGTVVYPSPRPSHRVPFGTGRSVARAIEAGEEAITFYRNECFLILAAWLALVGSSYGCSGAILLAGAERISPLLTEYLEKEGFCAAWERIGRVKKGEAAFLAGFHEWFDALRTMKLIHHVSADAYPRCGVSEGVRPLLERAGSIPAETPAEQLGVLREMQNGIGDDHHVCMINYRW